MANLERLRAGHTEPFELHERRQYTATRACQWSGATPRQLRYWDRIGLARPSIQTTRGTPGIPRLYSAADLRRLQAIVSLLWDGWTVQSIRVQLSAGLELEEIARNNWRQTGRALDGIAIRAIRNGSR
jgi:DNA-binding transcriptional MerR regulator